MKTEIQIGQHWAEKGDRVNPASRRVMRVNGLIRRQKDGRDIGEIFAVKLVLIAGKGKLTTRVQPHILRASWVLTQEAPDGPMRSIGLVISPATATHCGGHEKACQARRIARDGEAFCGAFRGLTLDYDESVDAFRRLPECIAAEQKSAPQEPASGPGILGA